MEIEKVKLKDNHIGGKVTYIPPHANNDASHKDSKGGTISSWNDTFIFINFGLGTNHACNPGMLVWG